MTDAQFIGAVRAWRRYMQALFEERLAGGATWMELALPYLIAGLPRHKPPRGWQARVMRAVTRR